MTDTNDALRSQITRTRADLGETVNELAARTDVKARTQQAVTEARDHARDAAREAAESASMRTGWVAGSATSSARSLLSRVGDSPAMRLLGRLGDSPATIAAGGAAGALAGLGLYALLGRRLPVRLMLRRVAPGSRR
jgi:hypothetical protein